MTSTTPAMALPIAGVAVDVPLAHLDRAFDYLVTAEQDEAARPGVRVRVRFAGQLVGGIILDRRATTDHSGRIARVERVLGAEPVLSAEVAGLVRDVADHWAGTFADVVRLAVPPRHATAERRVRREPMTPPPPPDDGALDRYEDGRAIVAALAAASAQNAGESAGEQGSGGRGVGVAGPDPVRRSWQLLPGSWPAEVVATVQATLSAGRGVVVVVPDAREVARLDAALSERLGPDRHVALSADLGPAERYHRFLRARRGEVQAVLGTRAAVWSPVHDLGLIVVLDDGDDLLAEPRAPYPHARDVAIRRAHRSGASLLLAGHAVSCESAALVQSGWAATLRPTPTARAGSLPRATASGGDEELERDPGARAARLPSLVWRTAQAALTQGPVLVQVPRRGYQPGLACATCREPARCRHCGGPLGRGGEDATPTCRWCGRPAAGWVCPTCGGATLRSTVVGARRTADELGRAFPGVPVRTSGGTVVLERVGAAPALVVATPGAEPSAEGGYAATVLLDGGLLLARPDLRAAEEALRRWLNAAALTRSAGDGGTVVVVAPGGIAVTQALVRWSPGWYADRELAERAELHLPPAGRLAVITGSAAALTEMVDGLSLPVGADVLGPVPVPGSVSAAGSARRGGDHGPAAESSSEQGEADLARTVIRVPRRSGSELAAELKAALAARSARKDPRAIRVQLDPPEIG